MNKTQLIYQFQRLMRDMGLDAAKTDIVIKDAEALKTISHVTLRRFAKERGFKPDGVWGPNADIYSNARGVEITIPNRDGFTDAAENTWQFIKMFSDDHVSSRLRVWLKLKEMQDEL